MLQTSGQELGLAPNTLLPACTEELALAQSRLTARYMAPRFSTGHDDHGVRDPYHHGLAHPD